MPRITKNKSEMEKLAELKYNRDLYVNHISDLQDYMLNFDNSNESLFELQARLEKLKCEFDNYEINQRELEMLDIDNLSELKSERNHYSSLYFKLVGQIHCILQNTSKDDSECVKSEVKSHKANVTNLPSIKLPTFSGNYQE